MLNRSVLIVRAKEPFVKWINSLPDPADVTREEVNEDNTVFLLPEYSYDNEQDEISAQFYDLIFEEQLNGWWTDENDWPANRDMATFRPCQDFS